MTVKAEPGHYGFLPYYGRPRIVWPGGARLAFWCAPNVEHYEIDPPRNPLRQSWARPHPDVLGYSWRDYGNRAGFWRMMEVMDRHGVRGSVSLNVAVADHFPEIVQAMVARRWELFSHGVYNTRYTYAMNEAQERELIADVRETIKRCSGQELKGWLAPALTLTDRTIELIAEMGLTYTLDLFHDDQPLPVRTAKGRLVSVPYSLEVNDFTALFQGARSPSDYADMIVAQFDRLYMEGEASGRVMCLPLHPFLIGQPHRVREFDRALGYIAGHAGVWLTTAGEIAEHFIAHHYDQFAAAIAAHEGGRA
jgi:peptidoglycan/xylan/chitin deacetylase (PgdA/CDA1 family)